MKTKNIWNKARMIAIILCCSIGMVACGANAYEEPASEVNEEETFEEYKMINHVSKVYANNFFKNKGMDAKEYIDYLYSFRDLSYEMPINENGYTEDELFNQVIPTMVSFVAYFYNNSTGKNSNSLFTGNIYDIDEEYIYLITCAHGLNKLDDDVNQQLEKINCRFVDDTKVDIYPDNILEAQDGNDFMMLKVEKDKISNETLGLLRTINFKNTLNYNVETVEIEQPTFYAYKYYSKQYWTGEMHDIIVLYKDGGPVHLSSNNHTIKPGMSGSGIFNIYGTYNGIVKNSAIASRYLFYIEDLINELNPDYFGE